MKRFFLTLAVLAAFFSPAFANQAKQLFQDANAAYQNSDFEKSTELYKQLVEMGYQSAELEYNLGNGHYRQGELGRAILHYERALLLSPHDGEILHNLELARSKTADEFQPLPKFFLTESWNDLRMMLPATFWGGLALLLWWAGMAGLGIWLFGKSRIQKKKGFFYGLILLAVSLLPLSLALSRTAYEQDTRHAIVLVNQTALRSAPDIGGSEIVPVHEGLKVKLLDNLNSWWQVQLPNGEKGWMEEKEVERI